MRGNNLNFNNARAAAGEPTSTYDSNCILLGTPAGAGRNFCSVPLTLCTTDSATAEPSDCAVVAADPWRAVAVDP